MNLIDRTALIFTGLVLALVAATAVARAQEATPAPEATPTLMDREYDGQLHITVAPYIWGPTVKGNFEFSIPRLPRHAGHTVSGAVAVGPSNYLSKLNSAGMAAVDVRKGAFDVFADGIYVNATATANVDTSITTPRRVIPISIGASARLATSIWEAAAGYTVARGHDADLSVFMGLRQFPVNLTVGYNATIGKRGLITPSGTVGVSSFTSDVITGLRGKAFVGDGHFFVPYYIDVGTGNSNQTWEGYTGAGYAFNHGQTMVFDWRSLNYYAFAPVSHVQKLTMYGPLLGYTFNI